MPKQTNKSDSEGIQLDIFSIPPETTPVQPTNRWLTVSYKPVSLFSLKRSDATSMAARSNLVPTPYAIKMALLKRLIEAEGAEHCSDFDRWIERQFTWIKPLEIYILPPEHLVVNRNGYKLRYYDQIADKEYRKANNKEAPPISPMQGGFVFREWVHLDGELKICCGSADRPVNLEILESLFAQINYFGKRSCFFQYLPKDSEKTAEKPQEFQASQTFTFQPMDDVGEKTTFSKINPYSTETAKLDKDRVIKPGFLPLRLVASSARYDFYERL